MLREFRAFLAEYKIIGLAIAVVIGGKLNEFVKSLVDDLLMPVVFQPALEAAGVAHIDRLHFQGVFYGRVLASAINFLVVAMIIFLFSKYVLREEKVAKK